MHTAGIVADHSAKIAVFVRGRVRAKGEIEFVGAIAKLIEHAAGLHPGVFFLRIDLNDLVQVFRKINDHGDVAGLSAEASAAAARQQRRVVLAGDGDGLDNFFNRLRNDYTNRHLAIIGAIDGVKSASTRVKADFAGDGSAQFGSKDIDAIAGVGGRPVLIIKATEVQRHGLNNHSSKQMIFYTL